MGKKELLKRIEEMEKRISDLENFLGKVDVKSDNVRLELNSMEKEVELMKKRITEFKQSVAISIAIEAKGKLSEGFKAIFDENFSKILELEKKAVEFYTKITDLQSKTANLNGKVEEVVEDVVGDTVKKIISNNFSEDVGNAVIEVFGAMVGDEAKKEIDSQLDFIEKETGIEKRKIYSIAINKAIDNISNSIAIGVVEKMSDTNEVEEKNIKPLDRDNELVHCKFDKLKTCVEAKVMPMLVGPAGTGKSTAVEQVARALGLPFYTMNRIQNTFELTGYNDAGGKYVSTQFYEAYKNGGVFFFDEIDASSPEALVTINTALAQGYMAFPNGLVNMHPDFRVVAAGNTFGKGANRQYCGRNSLDSATLDRFMIIEWDYDRDLESKIIADKELLEFAWAVRDSVEFNRIQIIISTRGIANTYKIIESSKGKEGFSIEESLEGNLFEGVKSQTLSTIINHIEKQRNISNNSYFKALVKLKEQIEKGEKR